MVYLDALKCNAYPRPGTDGNPDFMLSRGPCSRFSDGGLSVYTPSLQGVTKNVAA